MGKKKISLRPEKSGGKIDYVRVGPKWTQIKISLPTDRLQIQTTRMKDK
jgi:hypothetical protein